MNTQARDPADEYGFAGGPAAANGGYVNGPASLAANGPRLANNSHAATAKPVINNGYADMSGKRTPDLLEDKWYLKDSMRPVGAASHGLHCKCYRCQRKLTAI